MSERQRGLRRQVPAAVPFLLERVLTNDLETTVAMDYDVAGVRSSRQSAANEGVRGMTSRRMVMIVEDEILVAMDLAMSIEEAGFDVSGPHKSSAKALAALEAHPPDLAVLDLNLGRDETSEKVAERLQELGRPFVFLTGYSAASHPITRRFPNVQCLSKPVRMEAVTAFLQQQPD